MAKIEYAQRARQPDKSAKLAKTRKRGSNVKTKWQVLVTSFSGDAEAEVDEEFDALADAVERYKAAAAEHVHAGCPGCEFSYAQLYASADGLQNLPSREIQHDIDGRTYVLRRIEGKAKNG